MDEVPGDEESDESSLRIVVSLDGLRNFVLPLIWTVNNFSSTIQRSHFNTLQGRYQIPVDIPIYLTHKFEKCTSPLSGPIFRVSRHPDCSKCLENLSWCRGIVWGLK